MEIPWEILQRITTRMYEMDLLVGVGRLFAPVLVLRLSRLLRLDCLFEPSAFLIVYCRRFCVVDC
jgi:hypothetical protein